jgi:hypothetical protein
MGVHTHARSIKMLLLRFRKLIHSLLSRSEADHYLQGKALLPNGPSSIYPSAAGSAVSKSALLRFALKVILVVVFRDAQPMIRCPSLAFGKLLPSRQWPGRETLGLTRSLVTPPAGALISGDTKAILYCPATNRFSIRVHHSGRVHLTLLEVGVETVTDSIRETLNFKRSSRLRSRQVWDADEQKREYGRVHLEPLSDCLNIL